MSEFSTMLEMFVDLDPMSIHIRGTGFFQAYLLSSMSPMWDSSHIGRERKLHPSISWSCLRYVSFSYSQDYESVPANLKGVFVNAIEKGGPADKASIRGSNLDQYYQRHSGDMAIMSQRLKISCHIYTNTRPLAIV